MSQTVLADKLSVSVRTVRSYEHGSTQLDADELPRVAELLGVQPTAFFESPEQFIETCLGVFRTRLSTKAVEIMALTFSQTATLPPFRAAPLAIPRVLSAFARFLTRLAFGDDAGGG